MNIQSLKSPLNSKMNENKEIRRFNVSFERAQK